MELKIEYLPVGELKAYEKNTRKHEKYDISQIAKSIEKYGFNDAVGIWGDNYIVEGHGRVMAAKKLGIETVPCVRLDHLSDEERKEYGIIHNKSAELSSWDMELLAEELSELDMSDFDIDWELPEIEDEEEIVEDEPPEPPEEPKAKRGDIYLLGEHRLMCGDSTSLEDVQKLTNGQLVDMLLTDPPYNVSLGQNGGHALRPSEAKQLHRRTDGLVIQNDSWSNDEEFIEFLVNVYKAALEVMKPGAVFYIWYADSQALNFRLACKEAGMTVRQNLIWNKSVFAMGRQDYQWKHEPCSLPGTLVWTPDGEVPIEELKDGDRVISFDTYSGTVKGYKEGLEVKTASRHYEGPAYSVCVGDKVTKVTNNHRFTVRFNEKTSDVYCTYLMKRGKRWRVGVTRTYDARGFGLKHRFDQEKADAAWLISTYKSMADAQMGEQYLACKYGIPYTHWEVGRGIKNNYRHRTPEQIDWLYDQLDEGQMLINAVNLLADAGRCLDYPLITQDNKGEKFSRRATAKINACNLIPGLMQVPIPKKHYEGTDTFTWETIGKVPFEPYDGMVYSLAVDKYEHYVADGIITHNCLYGWKDGASHLWASDRKQTTVIDYAKPSKSELHPTMKPVGLFDYQIKNNTKGGDIVLDLFGGSGTSIIACEQNGRVCYTMELDERYADTIVTRYINLKGSSEDVFLLRDGNKYRYNPDGDYNETVED